VTTPPARPTSVKAAICLLVLDLIAGIVYNLLRPHPTWINLIAAVMVSAVVGGGICAAIAYGRRWAVYVYAVLNVGGLLVLVVSAMDIHHSPAVFVWVATHMAVEVAALVLLFSPSARSWFAAFDSRPATFNPDSGRLP
jgi:uncharacterized membrane protein